MVVFLKKIIDKFWITNKMKIEKIILIILLMKLYKILLMINVKYFNLLINKVFIRNIVKNPLK